ncbi:GMC oxidoreductase [Streptomyces sp. NPDC002644]
MGRLPGPAGAAARAAGGGAARDAGPRRAAGRGGGLQPLRPVAGLLAAGPLAALARRPGVVGLPPGVLEDDAALDAWVRDRLGTAQHTCGTVPMGPPDASGRAAVDQFGRVHGLRGLRVADTSILTPLPGAGPPRPPC